MISYNNNLFETPKKKRKNEFFTQKPEKLRKTNDTFQELNMEEDNLNFLNKEEKIKLDFNRYIPNTINKKEFLFYSDTKKRFKSKTDTNFSFHKILFNELKNKNDKKKVSNNKILNFSNTKEYNKDIQFNDLNNYNLNSNINNLIDPTPVSILEAPYIEDDFYLNLLEWSKNNKIGVCLQNILYFFDFHKKTVDNKLELNYDKLITSIKFDNEGEKIGVGTNYGNLIYLDVETKQTIRDVDLFNSRIVGLEYLKTMNSFLVGSKNCGYFLFDLRTGTPVQEFIGHKDEVIGIKSNRSETYLASGNNNNNVLVHSLKMKKPIFTGSHNAAVKALAWSKKNYNLLFSGGGSDDKCIKTWDILNNFDLVDSINTNSQVCNLLCLSNYHLLSSHGYKDNELIVWDNLNQKINKISSIKAHNKRVCYMSISPEENHLVTASGDETLKFWKLNFGKNNKIMEEKLKNNKYFR